MVLDNPILVLVLAIIGLLIQFWLVVYAVRRALQDHTIWKHTKWPAMKAKLDQGRIDPNGFPVP